jgi:hypothetical protein
MYQSVLNSSFKKKSVATGIITVAMDITTVVIGITTVAMGVDYYLSVATYVDDVIMPVATILF